MRILDLFCNAGGAGMGYRRAGFDVVGVDLEPQRNYPFAFIQHDALTLDRRFLRSFDAIHASPPCQGYTPMRHAPGAKGAPLLIEQTRAILKAVGVPWIIENVEEARWAMVDPITLCGSMFGLGAQGCQLRRHRLFESNITIRPPSPCQHDARPVIGVYGGHARRRAASAGGRGTRDVWEGGHRAAMSEAMGMTWATCAEMSEAIPPAFTEHLGRQLLAHIQSSRQDQAA
ncbi:DNA cytosine methyltransferase [Brevundimonas vesicularis]|nr:DNA cytosine methyltransferase [Brevundimonas vesicularis]